MLLVLHSNYVKQSKSLENFLHAASCFYKEQHASFPLCSTDLFHTCIVPLRKHSLAVCHTVCWYSCIVPQQAYLLLMLALWASLICTTCSGGSYAAHWEQPGFLCGRCSGATGNKSESWSEGVFSESRTIRIQLNIQCSSAEMNVILEENYLHRSITLT